MFSGCGLPDVRTYVGHCRGKIRFYTHPPEQQTLASHVSAEVVQQWSKEFDINALVEEEKKDLSGK